MFVMRRTDKGYLYITIDNKVYFVRIDEMGLFILDKGETRRIRLDSEGRYYIKHQDDKAYVLTEEDQQVLSMRQSRKVSI